MNQVLSSSILNWYFNCFLHSFLDLNNITHSECRISRVPENWKDLIINVNS